MSVLTLRGKSWVPNSYRSEFGSLAEEVAMSDVEVHIELEGTTRQVGLLRHHSSGRGETATFEYTNEWLGSVACFSIEPALRPTKGLFSPPPGMSHFGSLGDSAPDTWGRRIMQRAERRNADREGRRVRTLGELDYLLGVSDETRLGAMRFRRVGEKVFQAPDRTVPPVVELGRLLQVTERLLRDEETDDDMRLIFAPGSSLGGARPKASVIDQHGHLSIAKFPKDSDDYSIETWEEVALRLAERAGIETSHHELIHIAGKAVLLSRRFDRRGAARTPFLSAMSMLGTRDVERGSYPELADALVAHGARARSDAEQLYRRVVFSVLISNVDDHLRNHGFLWQGKGGWILSPAYDLNPTPVDVKARVLATNIDLDEATCSIDLLESAAAFFGLQLPAARKIIRGVADVTKTWRDVARDVGSREPEIRRMESAFEHDDLEKALGR
jgi:serine/threonine-protein kinase HipA